MKTSNGNHMCLAPILVLVLLAFGSRGVAYGQGSTDATLKGLTVSPVDIVGFDSAVTGYHIGVAYSVTQVTITATATDAGATIQIGKSRTDRKTVASGSGHVVSLVEGQNSVGIWVTSSGGNTSKRYWIAVGRGVDSAFGWKAVDDFNTLYAAGNQSPGDIWSDGETMWVTDQEDIRIYAYNMETKKRDLDKDFETLEAAGNENPRGIWSDGETMWVADRQDRKLYAYDLATRERRSARDFDFRDQWAIISTGLWSDGKFMYVPTSVSPTIPRYDLENEVWDRSLPGVSLPAGLWSDEETLWVSNALHYKLHAINLATNELNPEKDFNTLDDAGAGEPYGIWSDGSTMWVVAAGKIFSFNMPSGTVLYDSDGDGLIEIGSLVQLNAVRWDLDGDGAVDNDANVAAYAHAFPNAVAGMGCPTTADDADDNDCTGYELMANLDFDTNGDGTVDAADNYWHDGAGWVPIGSPDSGNEFIATFEGNDHTIDNLSIARETSPIGLFGVVGTRGQVRNVGVREVTVSGHGLESAVGGLAGINRGSIVASYATGLVLGEGLAFGGGLVGVNTGSIAASYAAVVVKSIDSNAGGLVGAQGPEEGGRAIITASYATGAVSRSGVVAVRLGMIQGVGGLVGLNIAVANGGRAIITASYATGDVWNDGASNIGGLVGFNLVSDGRDCRSIIAASYATGDVWNDGASNIGGLVGLNLTRGSSNGNIITASYAATGEVMGNGNIGGLVGQDSTSLNANSSINHSYWNTETSGQATSDGGTGKTTVELVTPTGYTGIYFSWNLDLDDDRTNDDPWDFGTSSEYPVLRVDFDGDGDVDAADIGPQRLVTLPPSVTTDFNGDGRTNFADFFLFVDAYGGTDARFDLDGNGAVDAADFFLFVDAFGS